ncbi:hypothetical protein BJV78DRAFT_1259229 [Lactifluus subvellereus]|nr:hypothetical protein BJV78DRAFT_1259229 [Lactifluus subvellereus]
MVERSGCSSMSLVVCWLWARVRSFFQLTVFSPWTLASVGQRASLGLKLCQLRRVTHHLVESLATGMRSDHLSSSSSCPG